jgi:hypothetical protein
VGESPDDNDHSFYNWLYVYLHFYSLIAWLFCYCLKFVNLFSLFFADKIQAPSYEHEGACKNEYESSTG